MVFYQGLGIMVRRAFPVCPTGLDVARFALSQGAGISHLVSGFLIKGIDTLVVVDSLCLRMEGEFRAFYVAIWLMSRESQLVLLTSWNYPGSQILFPSLRAMGTGF